jgi:hypothetical protein
MSSRDVGRESGDRHVSEKVTARRGIIVLLVLAALLPAIVAYGILYRQALSVPYQDDYEAILAFASAYKQLPTLKQKALEIAAEQHNEYKLGFEHSIVAAELEFTHHLNFAFLIALGDLFLLPIGYLLWRTYQDAETDPGSRLLQFLPISFLFFSLTYWENLNWAMTGLQNTPVILFSLLAIYLVTPRKMVQPAHTRLLLGCLAAALAACASANGFLLGPVGLLIFLPRRAYARSMVWCASFVLPLAAYLYHFVPVVHPQHRASYITRPLFFFAFLGGVVPFRWAAALLGILILAIVLLAVRSRFDRTNPVAFYFAVWIMATVSLVAWVRGAVSFSIASRYSMYSILMLIFCYSFLAQYLPARSSTFQRRRFYVTAIVIAVCFCVAADVHAYRKLGARRRMVLSGIEFYRASPEVNSPMIDSRIERAAPEEKAYEQGVLTEAIDKGIYTLPPQPGIR